jgi:putative ABC transport system permease protein
VNWRRFFRREQADTEQREELEFYVDLTAEEYVARGMREDDARRAAKLKLGNPTWIREEVYRMNTVTMIETLSRSLRQMFRTLRRNPMFAIATLLTLTLGIGANTAVFSVVNSVLLKPLPYPNAEELVSIQHTAPGAPGLISASGDLRLSASMYFTYADNNRSFQEIGAWIAGYSTVTGQGEPEELRTVAVTNGVLQALQVQPVAGRWLSKEDQTPGAPRTVMLGYGYWQRRFGGDPSLIGRSITIGSQPTQVVGVMPQGFQVVDTETELILPFAFDRAQLVLPGFAFHSVARLRPGVPIEQASADIARMIPLWMSSWPAPPGVNPKNWESWKITPALRPLEQDVVGNVRNGLWVVMATIGIVLLIACANVANLLLVRADGRHQELAVRAALGAGWSRIAGELLLESASLSLLGGVFGLGFAWLALRFLIAIGPASLPRLNEIGIDIRVLGFTFAISLVSGVLFGLIPALKYAGPQVSLTLRSGNRSSDTRERHHARNVLVVIQVALALVLLVSSGLMIRTFQALRRVDPGYTRSEQIQTMRIAINPTMIPDAERAARTQNAIAEKLAAIPGVVSVGYATNLPNDGLPPNWDSVAPEGRDMPLAESPLRRWKYISPGFLGTMGTRLTAGRDYTWTDVFESRPVVMISENLAREFWETPEAAVGKRIGIFGNWREIIGVTQDVHEDGVDKPSPATVLWPVFGQSPYRAGVPNVTRNVTFAIRTPRAGTEGFLKQVQEAVWSVNSNLPVAALQTMSDLHNKSLARSSFTLVMLALAGTMALALGVIGIYGVIAYTVSQRSRELGIRMALGARPAEIRRMFLRYGLVLTSVGVIAGLTAAAVLSRLMSSLLFGVTALDPITFALTTAVLFGVTMAACYIPSRRAASIDPIETLRGD